MWIVGFYFVRWSSITFGSIWDVINDRDMKLWRILSVNLSSRAWWAIQNIKRCLLNFVCCGGTEQENPIVFQHIPHRWLVMVQAQRWRHSDAVYRWLQPDWLNDSYVGPSLYESSAQCRILCHRIWRHPTKIFHLPDQMEYIWKVFKIVDVSENGEIYPIKWERMGDRGLNINIPLPAPSFVAVPPPPARRKRGGNVVFFSAGGGDGYT